MEVFLSSRLFLVNMNCLRKKMFGFVSDGAAAVNGRSNYTLAEKEENLRQRLLSLVSLYSFFIKKHCVQNV